MKQIEGMDAACAARAKKLNRNAIKATIHTLLTAELALVISMYPPALELDEFVKEKLAVIVPPLQERVILVKVSLWSYKWSRHILV